MVETRGTQAARLVAIPFVVVAVYVGTILVLEGRWRSNLIPSAAGGTP